MTTTSLSSILGVKRSDTIASVLIANRISSCMHPFGCKYYKKIVTRPNTPPPIILLAKSICTASTSSSINPKVMNISQYHAFSIYCCVCE